jgi:hypothetical protein
MTRNTSQYNTLILLILSGLFGLFLYQKGDILFTKDTFITGPVPWRSISPIAINDDRDNTYETDPVMEEIVEEIIDYSYPRPSGIREIITTGIHQYFIDIGHLPAYSDTEDPDSEIETTPDSQQIVDRQTMQTIIISGVFNGAVSSYIENEIIRFIATSPTPISDQPTRDNIMSAFERYFPGNGEQVRKYMRL